MDRASSHRHEGQPAQSGLRRLLAAALSVVLVLPAMVSPVAAATHAASAPGHADPKVVIIVGPSGEVTADYRALGDEAAAAARRYTRSVVTLYSPDATWPRVKAALQNASVVVYLGHGNGWPSRYRSAPWPYSQNGLGLNTALGSGDAEHQYFGEYYLERGVRLARNAVVIFSHLCYASGNSEPGLPEDGLDVAVQRVDNYAAGFVAAGAAAVIAEGHLGPAYYVDRILGSHAGVAAIWTNSPTYRGHVGAYDSRRSKGFREYLDPDAAGSGFYRSLVTRPRLTTRDVKHGGTGNPPVNPGVQQPSPDTRPPAAFGAITASDVPTAGGTMTVQLPITSGRDRLPDNLTVGVRWDALQIEDAAPTPTSSPTPSATSTPNAAPSATPTPAPSAAPSLAPTATPSAAPTDTLGTTGGGDVGSPAGPSSDGWIVPEQLGDVVQTEVASVGPKAVAVHILVPQVRGLYRLTLRLSDADAVELGPTRVVQPQSYLVRVVGPLAVDYSTPPRLETIAGGRTSLAVRLTNSGADDWTMTSPAGHTAPMKLVAHWVAAGLDTPLLPAPLAVALWPLRHGASTNVAMALTAPATPGAYLLVLDVLQADGSSFAEANAPPHVIPVTVAAAAVAPVPSIPAQSTACDGGRHRGAQTHPGCP